MGYSNLNLSPNDPEFKEKYKTVIDAVAHVETHGTAEVTFTTISGMVTWRKKFYEYQKITGKSLYRAEAVDGHTLLLRYKPRLPRHDHGLVSISHPGDKEPLPAAERDVVVTEADLALAKRVLDRMAEKEGKTTQDYLDIFKEGADVRRSESGGDAADTGSSGRDD